MRIEDITKPRAGDFCLLCGGEPDFIGVFIPDDPMRWGAAPGKTRYVRYCLCEICKSRGDAPELVEKVIYHNVVLRGGAHVSE